MVPVRFSIGRRETQVSRQRADVVPPGVALTADFAAGFQQLLLRVDEAALIRKLSALIGAAPTRKIEFSDNTRSIDALHRLISYVVSAIDGSPDALPAQAVVELEQAVLTTFLFSNSHNFSKLLDQKPSTLAPWQVRRTEEYIEANWQDALTIESIAEAIGASARSIFLSFSKARGYSPMAFVKKTRLLHAQQKLQSAGPATTVTGVALECGFQNMGHFAMNYRREFGEAPSDTLSRAKGRTMAPKLTSNTRQKDTFSRMGIPS